MSHGLSERPVAPEPEGRSPVQFYDQSGPLAPELQGQDRIEQRMVAVPPVSDRQDERVRLRQSRQSTCGLSVIRKLAGDSRIDPVQDARSPQKLPGGRRLGVEDLVHEIAGDGAVLGVELL